MDALQPLVSGHRLRVANSLPSAVALVRELEWFKVRIGKTGREKFGAQREGQHDDLVLAIALAAWAAERAPTVTTASEVMADAKSDIFVRAAKNATPAWRRMLAAASEA